MSVEATHVLLAVPILLVATAAPAQPLAKLEVNDEPIIKIEAQEPARLVGEWPDPVPKVSLDLHGVTAGEALEALTRAAGWGLAVSGAEDEVEEGSLTISVKDRQATDLLELILETGGLTAKYKNGVVMVSPGGPTAPPSIGVDLPGIKVKTKPGHGLHIHGGSSKNNRVSTGGSVRVEKDEVVNDAVAMGGSVEVAGHVRGDAVAMGGSVILESGARVDGDAVAMGGEVIVPDDAIVHGDRIAMGGGSIGGLVGSLVGLASGVDSTPVFIFGILATLLRAITLLILALLIMAFAPERVERVREFLVAHIGQSALGGLGLLLGFVPLVVLLGITIVGIVLIPVVAIIFAAFLVFGLTALATWLGYRIPLFEERKSPMVAMLLGLAVIVLVDLIPLVGTPIIVVAAFVAAGAVMLSRFGRPAPFKKPPEPTAEPAL